MHVDVRQNGMLASRILPTTTRSIVLLVCAGRCVQDRAASVWSAASNEANGDSAFFASCICQSKYDCIPRYAIRRALSHAAKSAPKNTLHIAGEDRGSLEVG